MSVANLGPMAMTVGLFGVVFFVVGMSMGRQTGLSPEAIAGWTPGGNAPRCRAVHVPSRRDAGRTHSLVYFVRTLRSCSRPRRFQTAFLHLSKLRGSVVGRRGMNQFF